MEQLSPRTTALNHRLLPLPIVTSPWTWAPGAIITPSYSIQSTCNHTLPYFLPRAYKASALCSDKLSLSRRQTQFSPQVPGTFILASLPRERRFCICSLLSPRLSSPAIHTPGFCTSTLRSDYRGYRYKISDFQPLFPTYLTFHLRKTATHSFPGNR